MKIKKWQFRAHGSDKVTSTKYFNKGGDVTVGLPPPYTGKACGKWRPVYR